MTVLQLAMASKQLAVGSNLRSAVGQPQVQSFRQLPATRCMLLRCWVSSNSASGLSQQWQTQWAETSLNSAMNVFEPQPQHGGATAGNHPKPGRPLGIASERFRVVCD